MNERILCVDDDANILLGYQRALRKRFTLEIALGAEEALQAITEQGPYAVVVADMRMPGMNGVELLAETKRLAPKTIRMMLTGNADQQTALEAVNEGQIFRFMTKPCPPEDFARALEAALEQYRLVCVEQDLLSRTLSGSIKVLTDVLMLACPAAFGRTTRVRNLVHAVAEKLHLQDRWMTDIAALLSQIGCIGLPDAVLEKIGRGDGLTAGEAEMYAVHPLLGRDLIKNIPRLEQVAEIVAYQHKQYDGGGSPRDQVQGDDLPLGSRILKAVLDFDQFVSTGSSHEMAIAEMLHRRGWYDGQVVEALRQVLNVTQTHIVFEIPLDDLEDGQLLARDIRSQQGTLLCAKGQEITRAVRFRLRNYAFNVGIDGPIAVFVPMSLAGEMAEQVSGKAGGATESGLSGSACPGK